MGGEISSNSKELNELDIESGHRLYISCNRTQKQIRNGNYFSSSVSTHCDYCGRPVFFHKSKLINDYVCDNTIDPNKSYYLPINCLKELTPNIEEKILDNRLNGNKAHEQYLTSNKKPGEVVLAYFDINDNSMLLNNDNDVLELLQQREILQGVNDELSKDTLDICRLKLDIKMSRLHSKELESNINNYENEISLLRQENYNVKNKNNILYNDNKQLNRNINDLNEVIYNLSNEISNLKCFDIDI